MPASRSGQGGAGGGSAEASTPMLQVDHLRVEVAGRTVLHDIDLRLAPGGNVLFGPNGACDDEATALGAAYLRCGDASRRQRSESRSIVVSSR